MTGRRLSARSERLVNFVSFTTCPGIYVPFDVGYEKNADLLRSGAVGRKKQLGYSWEKCRPSDPAECHACCGTLAAAYSIPASNRTQPGGLLSGGVPYRLFGEAARSTTLFFFRRLDCKVATETSTESNVRGTFNTTRNHPRMRPFCPFLRRLSLPGLVDDPHIFGSIFSLPAMQDEIRPGRLGQCSTIDCQMEGGIPNHPSQWMKIRRETQQIFLAYLSCRHLTRTPESPVQRMVACSGRP